MNGELPSNMFACFYTQRFGEMAKVHYICKKFRGEILNTNALAYYFALTENVWKTSFGISSI